MHSSLLFLVYGFSREALRGRLCTADLPSPISSVFIENIYFLLQNKVSY
jgi:hypothetical protein